MAPRTKHLSVREIKNAYEVKILSEDYSAGLDDEIHSVIGMLFFQTRSHIQIDLNQLHYLPLSLLTQLLALGRDLRAKKRVLVLLGVTESAYAFFQRFHMLGLFFQVQGGLLRKKQMTVLKAMEGSPAAGLARLTEA
ncbi:hypothetical protein [Leptospira ryugenii]|nr:hypothetical protein [Leptospira ryugenii]